MRDMLAGIINAGLKKYWGRTELPCLIAQDILNSEFMKIHDSKKVGMKIAHWTILKNLGMRGSHQYFECQCDCGTIKEVANTNLSNGKSKSCGCCRHSG